MAKAPITLPVNMRTLTYQFRISNVFITANILSNQLTRLFFLSKIPTNWTPIGKKLSDPSPFHTGSPALDILFNLSCTVLHFPSYLSLMCSVSITPNSDSQWICKFYAVPCSTGRLILIFLDVETAVQCLSSSIQAHFDINDPLSSFIFPQLFQPGLAIFMLFCVTN